jgi:PAS domain-containing protein
VIEWDGDLRITGWSKGAERIFGWTAQEAVGSIIGRDLKLIHDSELRWY